MSDWLALVAILGLAAYRITRVVTTDSITERARERLYRWAWVEPDEAVAYQAAWMRWNGDAPIVNGDAPVPPMPRRGGFRTYVNELFNCPWCLGVWVSIGLVVAWELVESSHRSIVWLAILAAAVAGFQGFVASRNDA